jgi:hypothetical protein
MEKERRRKIILKLDKTWRDIVEKRKEERIIIIS